MQISKFPNWLLGYTYYAFISLLLCIAPFFVITMLRGNRIINFSELFIMILGISLLISTFIALFGVYKTPENNISGIMFNALHKSTFAKIHAGITFVCFLLLNPIGIEQPIINFILLAGFLVLTLLKKIID